MSQARNHDFKITVTNFPVPASLLAVPLDNNIVPRGMSFSLTCVAQGQPLPAIHWFRDTTTIVSGVVFNITEVQFPVLNVTTVTSILELCDAELLHSGPYACSANNSLPANPQLFSNVVTQKFNLSVLSE